MRYKDIKVGMTVARKSWTSVPYVVVSTTQHLRQNRWSWQEDRTTVQVTSDKGELVTTSAHFVDNPSGTPRKVVVARLSRLGGEKTWYLEELALTSIVGPYDEVREAEDREFAARRKAEAEAAARSEAAKAQTTAALEELVEAGLIPNRFRPVGRFGKVEMTPAELTAIVKALA